MFHAAHPVPHRYLRTLAPEQLENLKEQLVVAGAGYEDGGEMRDRVGYTVDAIEEVLGDEEFLGEQMRRLMFSWVM